MNREPNEFAFWLMQIKRPTMSISDIRTDNIDWNFVTNEDLLGIMYYGGQQQSIKALRMLQGRFEDELNALNDSANYQSLGR